MADARSDEAASEVVKSVLFSFYMDEEVRRISVKKITKPDLFDAKNTPVPDGLYDPALGPIKETDSCKSCGQLSVRCPGHCGHIDLAKPLYHPLLFKNLKNLLQVTCFYCHNFRLKKEKVQSYASKLDGIIKGDVVKTKRKAKSGGDRANKLNSKNSEQQAWSALQYSEAMSVLNQFMREKHKKCANCGQKNPTITSPTFGWFNKDMQSSDIRANIIRGCNIHLSSAEGDRPNTAIDEGEHVKDAQSKEDGASLTDEEVSVPAKASRKTKHLKSLSAEITEQMSSRKTHLLPSEVEVILEDLWKNEARLCMLICDIQHSLSPSMREKGYAMFLLKVLLVPPSKFRPPAATAGRGVLEHPQNVLLSRVQEANISLRNLLATDISHPDTVAKWMDLQKNVNVLFDSSKGFGKSERETTGIRQILEKKSGILRQKIMGKRVNFACRSVISPDPYLAVNEIGIPPYFAVRLTYPERVTPWNVSKLRHAIINGADIHPGATHYKDKDRMYRLQVNRNMRNAISRKLPTSKGAFNQTGKGPESEFEGKVVYRHLQDGDIVLVNRQPTLHKPSMMAHVVRVLKGEKTIRMHYANCSTYNADFDGDEMNVHFPQDEISHAEAMNIVNANKQYIVPTSGEPIRGLIQDHIVSAVLLTIKDTFLTGEEFHQLLYASCVPAAAPTSVCKFGQKVSMLCANDDIQPLPPAIWKPKPLWTGKQVITAIICYITRGREPFTMVIDGRIPKEYFGQDCTERTLRFCNNEFIHGLIDKAQFGKYGLIHIIHELYGADTAGILLSVFSRLFTLLLQMHGFTCGVDDLLVVQESDLERKRILEKSEVLSKDVHVRFAADASNDMDQMNLHREIEKVIRSDGEWAITQLDRMMISALNNLTSEVNRVIFPNGLLKPFPSNCLSLMTTTGAKGGLVNMVQISSLLGQQELEGKRVPRMVSGKTLPCFPPWDIASRAGGFVSDRFLTGLRPQEYFFHCMAGRDGLVDTAIKTSRSGYLQRCLVKNLESLKVCYDLTVRDADGSVVQFMYGEDGVDVLKTSFLSKVDVLATNHRVVLESLSSQLEHAQLSKLNSFIKGLPDDLKEKVNAYVSDLSKDQRGSSYHVKRKDLMKLMKLKYLSSLAEPGEPVGVIAAQSVGEPSTQMTLNTFHFAGRGEMNVTLGVPRLQEILMNAKGNIRTPIMKCPLLDGRTRGDAEHLAVKLTRVTVADIIETMEVYSMPFSIEDQQISTLYILKMKLYPPELYPPNSNVTLEGCKEVLKNEFVEALEAAITKHLDMISKIRGINIVTTAEESSYAEGADDDDSKSNATQGTENDGGSDDNDDDENAEDHGTDAEKRKRQSNDEMEYEDSMEKEATMTDMHDEDPQSGIESENGQSEADEDYTAGREDLILDAEMESPSKFDAALILEDSRKEERPEARKKIIPKGSKKKVKRVVGLHFERLKFEVKIVLRKEPLILLEQIALKTAKRVFVKKSHNIERCSVVERKNEPISLQCAGVNLVTIWGMEDYLDVNKVVTNDIYAMLNTYGVEAARATIIKEVIDVFDAYGIRVNIRHLSLIADFMTCRGGYRPLNRLGMEHFGTSPFGKMTFETATKFMIKAATHAEVDTLECPSASVCLGQPVRMGTGCFDLMQNLQL